MLLSPDRLDALHATGLLDSPCEEAFDRLTRLASSCCSAPMSLVSLVDGDRQFFKSAVGLPEPVRTIRSTPLNYSFCRHVVESGKPLIVSDAREHPLTCSNPAIAEAGIIAYAGVPLSTPSGHVIGTLCVLDVVPRQWTVREIEPLIDLAAAAMTELALRTELSEREQFEREVVERALGIERERLNAMFESAPAFIAWTRGPDHVIQGANHAFLQLVGFRDVVGKTVAEALPETVASNLLAEVDRAVETGVPFVANGMRMLIRRDPMSEPEERILNFVYQPLYENGSTPSGMLCHGVDVTDQVRAAMAVEQSDRYHRQLLDTLPIIVYQASPEPPYEAFYVNQAIELLGYTREEWLADPELWTRCLHPDDRARMRREARDAYQSATPLDCQYRMIAKDGTVRWFHDRGEYLPDRTGERCVWQGIMLDITLRRQVEEALRESEARYRHVVKHAPGVVYQWAYNPDGTGGYTFVSESAETILGVTPDAALKDPEALLGLIPAEDRPRLRQKALEAAATSGPFHWEGRIVLPSGEERYIEIGARDQRTADGTVLSDGIIVDVTDRRQLEQQLRQSQKMEAVGRLAGGVAHDFNNLITIIKASTSFLLTDLDATDARADDVRQISEAADRAASLTRQLLAFSRKQLLNPRVLSLNTVVEHLRPMLMRLIGEDVAIESRLASRLGSIMADAGQLEQVLINLAVNARDAMPDGGRLTIETAEVRLDEQYAAVHAAHDVVVLPGTYAMLAVTDTGDGMTPDISARVFEPFFTTKPAGKGTGLGLPMVYGIVKQSGGHIWMYSERGHGTVVKIYFPVLEQQKAAPLVRIVPAPAPRGSETVLLVEDEAGLRRLARRILERQGYTVLESRNGREALELATCHEHPIHVVLTDVVMPEMSGRGLVERLRSVRPSVAVVYMSGYTDDDVLRRELFEPGSKFVQKPFIPEDLLRLVREALDRA